MQTIICIIFYYGIMVFECHWSAFRSLYWNKLVIMTIRCSENIRTTNKKDKSIEFTWKPVNIWKLRHEYHPTTKEDFYLGLTIIFNKCYYIIDPMQDIVYQIMNVQSLISTFNKMKDSILSDIPFYKKHYHVALKISLIFKTLYWQVAA